MTDYVNYKPIDLKTLLTNIDSVKYNPSNIQSVILTALSDASNGLINIVDPSNPFIFLLEAACVCATDAINESDINTAKLYSKLAVTPEDVYTHMSDTDFINKFAMPSNAIFTIMLEENTLLNNMISSPVDNGTKVVIPRNTVFTVNGVSFSLQYPIQVIKFNSTGLYQVSYDTTTLSPLQELVSNIITYTVRNDSNGNTFISFDVPTTQFDIISTQFTLQASSFFSQNVTFNQNYYYARVYYQNNSTNGKWVEIPTTYTKQVFDPLTLTALLKVVGNKVNISIPQVYINTGLVSGTIRVDVYETQGNLIMDMSNYNVSAFSSTFMAIDVNDNTVYTNALNNIVKIIYSNHMVTGGVNAVPFSTLRTEVINNTTGKINIPITNAQLDSVNSIGGFSLVKNIDVVTNRLMLAIQPLPLPTNNLLITPMCLSMNTFITSFAALRQLALDVNNNDIMDNTSILADGSVVGRITIAPSTVYLNTNDQISIYPDSQVLTIQSASIRDQIPIVNKLDLMFSPFYYVLDNNNDDFIVRAYDLNSPMAIDLDFVSQNASIDTAVNTTSFGLSKETYGYKLVISVTSDATYKAIPDINVGAQLAFTPYGAIGLAYLNGTLITDSNGSAILSAGERQFSFMIKTNYDLDALDNLILTNFIFGNNTVSNIPSALSSMFTILHYTNSVPSTYSIDSANSLLGLFTTPINSKVITYEKLQLTFGVPLTNLWSNCRSIANASMYQTYPNDIVMTYADDVYVTDTSTGSIFTIDPITNVITYTTLHKKGEVVLDHNNLPIKLHSAGDVMLDSSNNPIPLINVDTLRSIDILFMEGTYYFANDINYINYVTEVRNVLVNWITNSVPAIRQSMLEKTMPYFYAQRAMGLVTVLDKNGVKIKIESRQSFTVDLYVIDSVYNNAIMKDKIKVQTIVTINNALLNPTISISDIVQQLRTNLASNVLGVKVSGLGGINNYEILSLVNEQEILSINKVLTDRGDGTLIAEEDVVINFYNHTV